MRRKPNPSVRKIMVVALAAGVIGGAATYGGISYFGHDTNPVTQETAVPAGSSRGGTAKVNHVKVNVQTQSERAFRSVKDDVVSVVNLKREGGQTPLARRLPKRGFKKLDRAKVAEINVSALEVFDAGANVDERALRDRGLIKGQIDRIASQTLILPTAQATNCTAPTGGVLRPMPRLRIMMTPKCTGSMP